MSEHFLDSTALMKDLRAGKPDLKKKHLAEGASPVTSPVVAGPQASASPPPSLAPPQVDSLLKDRWAEILKGIEDRLGKGTTGLLTRAVPVKWERGVLTLLFDPGAKVQHLMAQANGRPELITQVLSEYLGAPAQVVMELASGPDGSAGAPTPAPSPARPRLKSREVLDDPAVKTVLLGLDATITGIEEQ